MRLLPTKAPSLHRRYPASSVLRASPPPHTARPGSRELPVDPQLRITAGASRVASGPRFHACRRHYPGRIDATDSLVFSHQRRPSLDNRRVGSCISGFEPCSAFTSITACMIAKSPARPFTSKASAVSLPPLLLRLLPGGAIQFPGGIYTHCGPAPFTAHSYVRFADDPTGRFLEERSVSPQAGQLPLTLIWAPSESMNCASRPPKSCFCGGIGNCTPLLAISV